MTVRFSDAVGMPNIPAFYDKASVRGCAMRFHLAEHVHTDILTHSLSEFSGRSAAKFAESLEAMATSVPAPAALAVVQAPKQIPKSFATESFFGVSAYQFTNESGRVQFGRYRVLPSGLNLYRDAEASRAKIRQLSSRRALPAVIDRSHQNGNLSAAGCQSGSGK